MSRRALTIAIWTAVLILGLVAGAVALRQTSIGPDTAGDPTTDSPASSSTSTSPPGEPSGSPTQTPSQTPRERQNGQSAAAGTWQDAARRFGAAYTNTSGGRDAWLARLRPLVSPGLAEGFSNTDLALIPNGRLVDVTKLDEAPDGIRARLDYNTNADADITIATDNTGTWVVTTIIPAENDGTTA